MTKAMLKSMLMQELQGICKMKVTKRQLKRIIREEALNEGLWDTIKGAVGMGPDPEEAGREIQNAFDKMGNGVGALLKLARKGSQMAKYWESFTGESRPEALMRGSIPSEFYRSSAKGSHGNILNSVGKLKDHWYDTMWNALVVAAPDASAELDQIFRDLASKPSDRTARKLRDIGVKIKDEALGGGKEDELVKFNKLLKQWAGEEINQSSFSANAWFNTHQGSFGLGESVVKVTKNQLRSIIKEAVGTMVDQDLYSYVHRALDQHWRKKNRGFMKERKFNMNADQIMDALMIDDVWQADVDELDRIVAQGHDLEELAGYVATWLAQFRAGGYSTPEDREKEMASWR